MWKLSLLFAALIAIQPLSAADALPQVIALWPAGSPTLKGANEKEVTKPENVKPGDRINSIVNVHNPSIEVHLPPKDKANGTAVIVAPGGGHRQLVWGSEGTDIAKWLNDLGVAAFILKYRLAQTPNYQYTVEGEALADTQRAIRLVRSRAGEWGVKPDRIGVLGFSAGGHLAAALSTNFAERTYPRIDEADTASCRPDFAVLIYPGYLVSKERPENVSAELKISEKTPPMFLVQAEDDSVPAENSLFFFRALKAAKIPAELHIYPSGGHGYGLRSSAHLVTSWPQRAADWMKALGLLSKE